jgi:hypothetical protein
MNDLKEESEVLGEERRMLGEENGLGDQNYYG